MCFINDDYDWTAMVSEWTERVAAKDIRCHDCNGDIQAGTTYWHLFQQEYEECQACEDGDCECPGADDSCHECQCEEPRLGEQANTQQCINCRLFRDAIVAAELEEDCKRHEAEPLPGELFRDLWELRDPHAYRRYFKQAMAMHPILKTNGYLTRAAKRFCNR